MEIWVLYLVLHIQLYLEMFVLKNSTGGEVYLESVLRVLILYTCCFTSSSYGLRIDLAALFLLKSEKSPIRRNVDWRWYKIDVCGSCLAHSGPSANLVKALEAEACVTLHLYNSIKYVRKLVLLWRPWPNCAFMVEQFKMTERNLEDRVGRASIPTTTLGAQNWFGEFARCRASAGIKVDVATLVTQIGRAWIERGYEKLSNMKRSSKIGLERLEFNNGMSIKSKIASISPQHKSYF